MTVKELRKKLENLPDNMVIAVLGGWDGLITDIKLTKEKASVDVHGNIGYNELYSGEAKLKKIKVLLIS